MVKPRRLGSLECCQKIGKRKHKSAAKSPTDYKDNLKKGHRSTMWPDGIKSHKRFFVCIHVWLLLCSLAWQVQSAYTSCTCLRIFVYLLVEGGSCCWRESSCSLWWRSAARNGRLQGFSPWCTSCPCKLSTPNYLIHLTYEFPITLLFSICNFGQVIAFSKGVSIFQSCTL